MGLWDDFYKAQTRPILPTQLPQTTGTSVMSGGHVGDTYSDNVTFRANHPDLVAKNAGEHPLISLIRSLVAPKPTTTPNNPQGGLVSLIAALRNDPVGDYNKLSSLPSNAPNSLSPFNTGFFKTAAQRRQIEFDRLGY